MNTSSTTQPSQPALAPPGWIARRPTLAALLLLLLVTLPWWYAVGCPFLLLDDPDFVIENPVVRHGLTPAALVGAFTTATGGLWIPLTFLSLSLDVSLFGLHPAGMHFTNVLLHIANTLLVFHFFNLATGRRWRSLLVAALFAMHPLRVESVAWAFERKDVLSIFFGLLALLAWRRYTFSPRPIASYLATVALLLLSLLAKPMLVTFPLLLLLLDFWPFNRTSLGWKRLLGEKLPLLVPIAAFSLITLYVQHSQHIMARLDTLPLSQRLITTFSAYLFYLRDTFYPQHLALYYTGVTRSLPFALGGALLVLGISLTAIAWSRRRPATGRPFLVGWLWFLGTLVPVIGILQSGAQSRADRYTYFPAIGLAAALFFAFPDAWCATPRQRHRATLLAALTVLLFSFATFLRIGLWRDPELLYRDCIRQTGPNGIVAAFLGKLEQDRGNYPAAEEWYRHSVTADPNLHKSFYNLGTVLLKRNRPEDALICFSRAAQLLPGNPTYEHGRDWTLRLLQQNGLAPQLPASAPATR